MSSKMSVRTRKSATTKQIIQGQIDIRLNVDLNDTGKMNRINSPVEAPSHSENQLSVPITDTLPSEKEQPTEKEKGPGPFHFIKDPLAMISQFFHSKFTRSVGTALTKSKVPEKVVDNTLDIVFGSVKRRLSIQTPEELTQSELILLNRQYELVYTRAEKSYRNATIASYLGLCILAIAIYIGISRKSPDMTIATAAGGAIVELVSALFLVIYSKSLEQLNRSQEQFNGTFNKLFANQLADRLPQEEQSASKIKIIDRCLSIQDKQADEPLAAIDPSDIQSPPQMQPSKPRRQVFIPGIPSLSISWISLFLLFIILFVLAWFEILPSAFLPIVIVFLGLAVALVHEKVDKRGVRK